MECIIPRRRQDSFVQSLENCVVEFKLETPTTIALGLDLEGFPESAFAQIVWPQWTVGQLWFLRFKSIEILSGNLFCQFGLIILLVKTYVNTFLPIGEQRTAT